MYFHLTFDLNLLPQRCPGRHWYQRIWSIRKVCPGMPTDPNAYASNKDFRIQGNWLEFGIFLNDFWKSQKSRNSTYLWVILFHFCLQITESIFRLVCAIELIPRWAIISYWVIHERSRLQIILQVDPVVTVPFFSISRLPRRFIWYNNEWHENSWIFLICYGEDKKRDL